MNTKLFIGRFPQIASLENSEQKTLLEQARYEAFVTLNLSGKATFYMVACMLLAIALAVLPTLLLGFNSVVQIFSLAIGLAAAGYLYQRLYRSLLLRGLENVLAKRGRQN